MNLELSPRAQRDLDETANYLIAESLVAARMFADTIEATFENLKAHPKMGRQTNNRELRVFPLTTFHFNIFYRIDGETLIIETIFHTAQEPNKL